MTSTTPNLSLTLYDSSTDQSVLFSTFRAVWGGPATTSNFYKIDTAYGVQAAQILALQASKGATLVSALYVSANYYAITGISGITAYTTGMSIILTLDTTSSGIVTLNINSLGIKSVMKVDSTGTAIDLTGSDLVKGRYYLFSYDGSRWLWVSANSADQIQIVGTAATAVAVGSTNNLVSTTMTIPSGTDTLVGKATQDTLTNKRITKRVDTSEVSSATPTINTDNYDGKILSALAGDITSMTSGLSGAPTLLQTFWLVIIPTAPRNITWGLSFESGSATLPTSVSVETDIGLRWSNVTSKWRCISVS